MLVKHETRTNSNDMATQECTNVAPSQSSNDLEGVAVPKRTSLDRQGGNTTQ